MSFKATCCSIVIPTHPTNDYPERVTAAGSPYPFAWVQTLVLWQKRWRQRRCLLDLNQHLLRDIGLTRQQAVQDASKPFWTIEQTSCGLPPLIIHSGPWLDCPGAHSRRHSRTRG